MKTLNYLAVLSATLFFSVPLLSEGDVPLPVPKRAGGTSLAEALAARQTVREFKEEPLPQQALSDLLWAAFGVNRAETGGRTAPSAFNAQETEIYILMAQGTFVYEAGEPLLRRVSNRDLRRVAGGPEAFHRAPLRLALVANLDRLERAPAAKKEFYAAIDAGHISQNVYLHCAANGLGAVVHEVDRGPLMRELDLASNRSIVIGMTIGIPSTK